VKPEADEQVGGETNQLPANKQQQEAVGDQEAEHGGGKEAEKAEEPRKMRILFHVTETEDEDQQAGQRDHHQHECRQRIEQPAQADHTGAEVKPIEIAKRVCRRMHQGAAEGQNREHQGAGHGGDRAASGENAVAGRCQNPDDGREQRQSRNEPEVLDGKRHGISPSGARLPQAEGSAGGGKPR
jgi:hypothetical protein